MSLATLKKKTAAKYNNMSVGSKDGFSLNGTRRSQGYIGQDTLGRSLLKTPMKGNVVKGSGGCCGTYKVSPVVQSAVTSLNDINVIKSTVGSSSTFLLDHSRAGYPENIVNNDSNINLNTQQDYIERTRKTAITNADNSDCGPSETTAPKTTCSTKNYNYQQLAKARNMNLCKNVKDLTKLTSSSLSNQPSGIATSYDLYMRKINDKCVSNDIYKFTRNIGGTPLPDNK